MGLGENIRFLRNKHGFSQDYVAEKLGYKSFTTIQKWESGVSEPPIKKLRELSELLNVDMDDIINKDIQFFETKNKSSSKQVSKNNIDIKKHIDKIMESLEGKEKLIYDGAEVVLTDYNKKLLRRAMEMAYDVIESEKESK